jgi:cytochrome c
MNKTLFMMSFLILAPAGLAQAQDNESGKVSFRKCQPCHNIGEGAKSLIGPELNGLEGRKSGSVEGYAYTDANKSAGIIWSDETFKDYIRDPRAKIPGTKMTFAGIKNDAEAADLWAFLKQFGPDGKKK